MVVLVYKFLSIFILIKLFQPPGRVTNIAELQLYFELQVLATYHFQLGKNQRNSFRVRGTAFGVQESGNFQRNAILVPASSSFG